LYENTLVKKENNQYSLSVYDDNLTTENIVKQMAKLKSAFPSLPATFFDILSDRIKDNVFTDKRLIDSVNNCIDLCVYPTPTVAQLISFDKRVKLYTYNQLIKMNNDTQGVFKYYKAIDTPELKTGRLYASLGDIELYNLKVKK